MKLLNGPDMKTFVCGLVGILLVTLSAANGDVVIYKGTLKNKGGEADRTAATVGFYLLVNFATKEVQSVTYYKKGGAKLGEFEVGTSFKFITTSVADKPTRVFADSATTDAANFSYDYTEYRGAEVSLVIRDNPATTTLTAPKSLTAAHRFVSGSDGAPCGGCQILPAYTAAEGVLNFQSKLTIDANNDSLTISAARKRIQDHLHDDLGYAIP